MKGVMLGICPGRARSSTSRTISRRTTSSTARLQLAAAVPLLPRRDDLPRGRRSRRRLGAARHRRRRRRLPVRRAGQRRPDAVLREPPRRRDRRAHRAPLRPADRQPHVRGPRSFCARGGVAGAGASQLSALGRAVADLQRLDIPVAEAGRRRLRGIGAARRSLRQPGHQHRPRTLKRFARERDLDRRRRAGRTRRWWRRTREIGDEEVCGSFGSTDHLELAARWRAQQTGWAGAGTAVEIARGR